MGLTRRSYKTVGRIPCTHAVRFDIVNFPLAHGIVIAMIVATCCVFFLAKDTRESLIAAAMLEFVQDVGVETRIEGELSVSGIARSDVAFAPILAVEVALIMGLFDQTRATTYRFGSGSVVFAVVANEICRTIADFGLVLVTVKYRLVSGFSVDH